MSYPLITSTHTFLVVVERRISALTGQHAMVSTALGQQWRGYSTWYVCIMSTMSKTAKLIGRVSRALALQVRRTHSKLHL